MVKVETLDIMAEIEALVSDNLQVVSYKWLSRNCSVSSNDAKRLLWEFVEKHGNGLEVIYSLSGWLKNNPSVYHIKLVSAPKLADVKKEFEDNCSIQVYSVQACIPKDPATLWNAEFVQTEELFNQPSTVDNCLRDNRFCGVLNSFVKRNVNGSAVGISPQQPKIAAARLPSKSNTAFQAATPKPHQGKIQQESPKLGQSSDVAAASDIKSRNNAVSVNAQTGKPQPSKEKEAAAPVNKNKAQSEKTSSVNGGSLANLWGRASAKAKPVCAPSETSEVAPNTIVTSAEAQICAREAMDDASSDEDGQTIKHKRTSNGEGNRKRRVVLDFSDEEDDHENAVSLASPDPPKVQSTLDSRRNTEAVVLEKKNLNFEEQKGDQLNIKQEKTIKNESCLPLKDVLVAASKSMNIKQEKTIKQENLNFEEQKGDQLNIKQEKTIKNESCLPPKDVLVAASKSMNIKQEKTIKQENLNFEEQKGDQLNIKQEKTIKNESCLPPKDVLVAASKSMNTGITLIEKTKNPISVDAVDKKDKVMDATSSSLKRRKVLKTRIDERGREVTEVVWDGEEPEPQTKKNEKTSGATAADNRPPAAKKSPALGSNAPSNPVSKAGAKKAGKGGGVKDAKQGNILSFFKRA